MTFSIILPKFITVTCGGKHLVSIQYLMPTNDVLVKEQEFFFLISKPISNEKEGILKQIWYNWTLFFSKIVTSGFFPSHF